MGRYRLSQLKFTEMTVGELDKVLEEITKEYSSCGWGLLTQILKNRGIKIQKMRLKSSEVYLPYD